MVSSLLLASPFCPEQQVFIQRCGAVTFSLYLVRTDPFSCRVSCGSWASFLGGMARVAPVRGPPVWGSFSPRLVPKGRAGFSAAELVRSRKNLLVPDPWCRTPAAFLCASLDATSACVAIPSSVNSKVWPCILFTCQCRLSFVKRDRVTWRAKGLSWAEDRPLPR